MWQAFCIPDSREEKIFADLLFQTGISISDPEYFKFSQSFLFTEQNIYLKKRRFFCTVQFYRERCLAWKAVWYRWRWIFLRDFRALSWSGTCLGRYGNPQNVSGSR